MFNSMEMSGRELLETCVIVVAGMALASAVTNAVGIDAFWLQLLCALAAGAVLGLALRFLRLRRLDRGRAARPKGQDGSEPRPTDLP